MDDVDVLSVDDVAETLHKRDDITDAKQKPKRGRPFTKNLPPPDKAPQKQTGATPVTSAMGKPTRKDTDLSTAVNAVGAMIAGLAGRPDLMLDKAECDGLSQAANRVAAYYELPDMGVVGAWANLGMTIGAIVMPRYLQLQAEKEARKAEKEARKAEKKEDES